MKRWMLAAPAALALALGSGARADVTYYFSSPLYQTVTSYTPPCSTGTCTNLPTGAGINGWFRTASPLPPNHLLSDDITPLVTGWSFSNGAIGISGQPARPDIRVHGFKAATDAQGNIVQSVITVSRWVDGAAGPHATDALVDTISANTHGSGSTLLNALCKGTATVGGVGDTCILFAPHANITSQAAYPAGGTWTLDAPRPAFRAAAVSATEGFAGTRVLVFTVTPDKPSATMPMSLDWRTVAGTASAGSDYTAASGTLTWPPGNRDPQHIEITLHGDTAPEADESFTVELSHFVGMAPGATTQATGTILNDDAPGPGPAPPPTVTLGNATLAEGHAGTSLMTFTATLSSTPTAAVTLQWSTANGTATAGSDYTAATGTLQWDAGDDVAKTFTVAIHGDTTAEADEAFTVALSHLAGATAGASTTGTGTIANDDGTPPPAPGGVQPVPTLSGWAVIALSAALALAAALLRRRPA
ncbi:IPTL-CTERM sorting domain-containing protein [Acidovorax sp. M2(2025)]|uniref:IPTL-CTERM sorting domain-containing protein n=1 Tax=Acidovorax sp. M2(2025) TaxID=3411355 RepID=UPI003BF4E234